MKRRGRYGEESYSEAERGGGGGEGRARERERERASYFKKETCLKGRVALRSGLGEVELQRNRPWDFCQAPLRMASLRGRARGMTNAPPLPEA